MILSIVSGRKVEGFVLKSKGRDKGAENCYSVPWCYEFTPSGTTRQARIGAETGKTSHTHFTTTSDFPYGPASKPCRWPCGGIFNFCFLYCRCYLIFDIECELICSMNYLVCAVYSWLKTDYFSPLNRLWMQSLLALDMHHHTPFCHICNQPP